MRLLLSCLLLSGCASVKPVPYSTVSNPNCVRHCIADVVGTGNLPELDTINSTSQGTTTGGARSIGGS